MQSETEMVHVERRQFSINSNRMVGALYEGRPNLAVDEFFFVEGGVDTNVHNPTKSTGFQPVIAKEVFDGWNAR